MNKCKICENDSGKGRTCSDKCRQALRRRTVTSPTVTDATVTPTVTSPDYCIVDGIKRPLNYGQADCTCRHCKGVAMNKLTITLNHGQYKLASQLAEHERNRVALPGDIDYYASV